MCRECKVKDAGKELNPIGAAANISVLIFYIIFWRIFFYSFFPFRPFPFADGQAGGKTPTFLSPGPRPSSWSLDIPEALCGGLASLVGRNAGRMS